MMKLEGDAKLLARFNKIKKEKQLYRFACREGAKIVASQVKTDLPQRTGATARQVKVRSAGKLLGAKVVVGLPGTDTYRGWFLEHGTKARFTKSGAFRGLMLAGNFVQKATAKIMATAMQTVQGLIKLKVLGE